MISPTLFIDLALLICVFTSQDFPFFILRDALDLRLFGLWNINLLGVIDITDKTFLS